MTRHEYHCDVCGRKVRGADGVTFEPFLGLFVKVVNARPEITIATPAAANRHVCEPCLGLLAGLHATARTTGYEGARSA